MRNESSLLHGFTDGIDAFPRAAVQGQVTQLSGMLVEGIAMGAQVGGLYCVGHDDDRILAEVVALKQERVLLMPFGDIGGLGLGDPIIKLGSAHQVRVGDEMLGRVVDAFGRPLDGLGLPDAKTKRRLHGRVLRSDERGPVDERMALGVRCLDAFTPFGRGQRVGIFAGPGVGKSVLMGMAARYTQADVSIVALVGERGREVNQFVSEVLGEEGLKRSVVVAATSDRSAPERVRAAFYATSLAEHFRDEGKSVLLFVDSLTRLCMAQREIGLSVGEPPTTKGYPPSAFGMLPKLLERVAPLQGGGSITGLYTVLVEGDDMTDPVADTAKGLLDGHIVLSRDLAASGHYPAVDVLSSLSRVEPDIADQEEIQAARKVRRWLAKLEDAKDLIAVGAYQAGADPLLDEALNKKPKIEAFLQQSVGEHAAYVDTRAMLLALGGGSR
jgi:flagellum-specific ATP synthase